MLKSRFFMGIGLGMIGGALLLQLMLIATETIDSPTLSGASDVESELAEIIKLENLTEEQWLSQASRFQYRTIPNSETVYSEHEFEEALARVESDRELVSETTMIYAVPISRGMTAGQVAELLFSLELIPSIEQFINYMTEAGLNTQIKAGNYQIIEGTEMVQLVALLTNNTE